jgi:hypothetical protein
MVEPDSFCDALAEMHNHTHPILPGSGCSAHDGAVSAPRVYIELIKTCDNTGPLWIEMDIADQFQKVGFFLANY